MPSTYKRLNNMMYLKNEQNKLQKMIERSKSQGRRVAEKEWRLARRQNEREMHTSQTSKNTHALKNQYFGRKMTDSNTSRRVKDSVPFALKNCEKLMRLKSANARRRRQKQRQKYETQPVQSLQKAHVDNMVMFSERGVENNSMLLNQNNPTNSYLQAFPIQSGKLGYLFIMYSQKY